MAGISRRSDGALKGIGAIFITVFLIYGFTKFKNSIKISFIKEYPGDINIAVQSFQGLAQDDPKILKYILKNYIYPPSTLPYNLETKESDTIHEFTILVQNILGNKTSGVFVEAGAYDGEYGSTTLHLERFYGWTGLLVEPTKVQLPKLHGKRRKSWISDVCLSPNAEPGIFEYLRWENYNVANKLGTMKNIPEKEKNIQWNSTTIVCFPVYSILSAVKMKYIDYFSLDVEGAEYKVLKTIPFESVSIKIFSVEHQLLSLEVKNQMKDFMKSKGYNFVVDMGIDFIFAHGSVYQESEKL